MGTKKPLIVDDRQLQLDLWKEFDGHVEEIAAAIAKLRATAEKLIQSGAAPQEVKQAVTKVATKVEEDAAEIRSRLNKVVKVHMFGKNLTAKEIWRIIYARLKELTGINVIAKAIAKGKKCYLDIVQELGLLQKTLDIAAAL